MRIATIDVGTNTALLLVARCTARELEVLYEGNGGGGAFTFGLLTDFRGVLFEGTSRLLEVADRRQELQEFLEAGAWEEAFELLAGILWTTVLVVVLLALGLVGWAAGALPLPLAAPLPGPAGFTALRAPSATWLEITNSLGNRSVPASRRETSHWRVSSSPRMSRMAVTNDLKAPYVGAQPIVPLSASVSGMSWTVSGMSSSLNWLVL